MPLLSKNWDLHVEHAEEVARQPGFQDLRDHILDLATPGPDDTAVDVGAGTGLLTLPLAAAVNRVWAIDISASMGEYLRLKAASAELENVEVGVASAVSLPLVAGSTDLVVSNYCFHHLAHPDKVRALDEAFRVLRPGGRLVFGDMMFGATLTDPRDRRLVRAKLRALARKGPGGILRIAKNGARVMSGRWEQPARPDWWRGSLRAAGFVDVEVHTREHEGGVAFARRP